MVLTRSTHHSFWLPALFLALMMWCGFLLNPSSAVAYLNYMEAAVVVGQPDFQSSTVNYEGSVTARGVNSPRQAIVAEGKLILYDATNRRVLIWNSIPTTNGAPADVVIGQNNLTENTLGTCVPGPRNLRDGDGGAAYVNGKLFLVDPGQNRILAYNSIPTENGQLADFVVGQPNLTTCTSGSTPNKLFSPSDVTSDGTRLFVSDSANNRILIYNTIPSASNASADVVVGQPDFSTTTLGVTQTKFSNPRGIAVHGGKLLVGERGNYRVAIFNSIPTTNGAPMDVALGQTNFTSNVTSPPSNTYSVRPFYIAVDPRGRLLVSDRDAHRYLVWNTIPSSNTTPADFVLGQPNFTASTANNGGLSARSLNLTKGAFATDNQLIVVDQGNNRILIYNGEVTDTALSLNNSVTTTTDNRLQMSGTAQSQAPYSVQKVEFSINNGGFVPATPTDGSFDSSSETFTVTFDPNSNPQKDESGQTIPGYTIQVRASDNNLATIDNLFFFSPFVIDGPDDGTISTTNQPNFTFSVNKLHSALANNLAKYQIQIRNVTTNESWRVLADNIPVTPPNQHTVYETSDLWATYSNGFSTLQVYSKTQSLGPSTYEWKVVAIDHAGHSQETGSRKLIVPGLNSANPFPLAVLNITGVGNPLLSTTALSIPKLSFTTPSTQPIFYGIAGSGSSIKLLLTQQNCSQDCTQLYTTTANDQSRFGINIPRGGVLTGKSYQAQLSAQQGDNYTALPLFTLTIGQPRRATTVLGATDTAVPNTPTTRSSRELEVSNYLVNTWQKLW